MALTKISGDVIKDGISVSGIVTASRFSGNVTGNINSTGVSTFSGGIQGNLTGNVSGNINSTGVSTITTLRATNITGVSTAGITTAYITSINDGPISGARNRIINGDMRIDQRNAGASVSLPAGTTQAFVTDRWWVQRFGGTAAFSGQRSTVAPAGFTNSLVITTTTADSPAAGDTSFLAQRIEGFNVADLGWGTSAAQTVTVSFWVRSSLTGTFSGALNASGSSRSYAFTFAISAANTWEQKTITIPGDTSGTWLTDNGWGIQVCFDLGCGTTPRGTAGSWISSQLNGVTGAVILAATNAATFYITGVQLEAGTVATPFERRSYGQELALCQRYFWKSNPDDAANGNSAVGARYLSTVAALWTSFPVPMRSAPLATFSSTSYYIPGVSASATGTTPATVSMTTQSMSFESTFFSGTIGQVVRYNGQISASAEL